MTNERLHVEPLRPDHDRSAFSCGEPALAEYLRVYATQDRKRGLATVFVLIEQREGGLIGYYTLSSLQVEPASLPDDLAKRLPRRPVPATLLGRLAVDRRAQGRGFGEYLLLNALRRALRASTEVASLAVVVDAKNDGARAFYERFGFRRLSDNEMRLHLPMQEIARL